MKTARQRHNLFRRVNLPSSGDLRGKITVVQEDRFRLEDADGRGYLLVLSRKAGVSMADLEAWHRGSVELDVRYEGTPDLGALAMHVRPST